MKTNKLKPVQAQNFTGEVAEEFENSYRTVPDLLRDIAKWMDENQIDDTEFSDLVFHLEFMQQDADPDTHYYTAVLYHIKDPSCPECKGITFHTDDCKLKNN